MNRTVKKLLSLLLCATLCLSLLPASLATDIEIVDAETDDDPITVIDPSAEEPEVIHPKMEVNGNNGSCGDNLTWVLDDTGALTIAGSGKMWGFAPEEAPWFSKRDRILVVVLENDVTSVGSSAFYGCTKLTSVAIPKGVTSIGNNAFYGCAALTALTLPEGVTSVGYSAFANCTKLASITLPDSLLSLGERAFALSVALISVKLPGGVTNVNDETFYGCTALKSVTLPDGLLNIGDRAFCGCGSLTALAVPAGVKSIGEEAFYGCKGLTALTVPEGVTSIADGVFSGCSGLKSINIPKGVTGIGEEAFRGCASLTAVDIPASVAVVGMSAFRGCTALKTVTFRGAAPKIRTNAFQGVIAKVYYPNNQASWTDDVCQNYGGTLTWLSFEPAPVLSLSATTAGIKASWTEFAGAEKYQLQCKAGSKPWADLSAALTETEYTDATVKMGETYQFQVRAFASGAWSEYSEPVELMFNPFTDVPNSGKTLEYVSWAFNNGIVTGTSDTMFAPDGNCSRVQFILMLWKMHGSPTVSGTNPFKDVKGAKTTKAILWALDEGIINSGKYFRPDQNITRIQIVMILWKMAGSPKVESANPFTDVSGAKTTMAVLWAYHGGITKGTTATTFSPDKVCTRIQLVIFLYKYNNLYSVI